MRNGIRLHFRAWPNGVDVWFKGEDGSYLSKIYRLDKKSFEDLYINILEMRKIFYGNSN